MAKNEENKEIVKTSGEAVPAFLQQSIDETAGMGNSTAASDNTMPFLAILQGLSPQLEENKAEYIEGARKGMLFNTATKQLYDTKNDGPVEAVAFAFQKNLVEWIPRDQGGGFVEQHPWISNPKDMGAKPKIDPKSGKQRGWVLDNGHDIVDTLYTFLLFPDQPMPVIIGATSTAHKPMRDWMTMRNNVLIGGKPAPSFAKTYKFSTVYQENEAGSWYTWKIDMGDWVSEDLYKRAFEFAKMAAAGDMVVGRPADAVNDVGGTAPGAGDDGINV